MCGVVPSDGGGGGMKRLAATAAAALAVTILLTVSVSAAAPAPDKATAKFEVDFLSDMIDHHQMAVDMAESCTDRADHDELVALCEEIVAAQLSEIEMMQAWLAEWYGVTHEPEMTPGMMAQTERLASLDGAEFEIAFMKTMIRHHTQAILEAEACLDRASHGDLRAMCQEIIAAQQAEMQEMQAWLCDWYDRCGYFGARRP